jgi:hypothetical protein
MRLDLRVIESVAGRIRGIFVEDAYIAGLGGIAAIIVAVAISVCRSARSKKVATYDAGASNARVGES